MPLFTHDLRRSRAISPTKSQLETMIARCKELENPINTIIEDGEEFGGITEDTYCYTAPKLLDSLRAISKTAAICVRDLNENGDEYLDPEDDPVSLELFQFICEHRRVLDSLMAQHETLRWSGSFYRCIAQTLRVQRATLEAMRNALVARYPMVRMNTAEDWNELSLLMAEATSTYVDLD